MCDLISSTPVTKRPGGMRTMPPPWPDASLMAFWMARVLSVWLSPTAP